MARPTKSGLDYFPLDTKFDEEIEMLEMIHGDTGLAVWIKTLQLLYRTDSGTVDFADVFRRKMHAKRLGLDEERMDEIIATCIELRLFHWENDEQTVLGSRGVQKRLRKVVEEREKGRQRHQKSNGVSQEFSGGKPSDNGGKESEREMETQSESETPPESHAPKTGEVTITETIAFNVDPSRPEFLREQLRTLQPLMRPDGGILYDVNEFKWDACREYGYTSEDDARTLCAWMDIHKWAWPSPHDAQRIRQYVNADTANLVTAAVRRMGDKGMLQVARLPDLVREIKAERASQGASS